MIDAMFKADPLATKSKGVEGETLLVILVSYRRQYSHFSTAEGVGSRTSCDGYV